MSKRVITLPNGKKCGLGVYVKAWRTLKTLAPGSRVNGFDHFPEDAAQILREIRKGMHDRINQRIPAYGVGRKWHQDWQRHALQCAHDVNTPRLIVRWVPWDLRLRLAHRITRAEDE
jgi:hypothetical protein